jgi:ubiquinone/menaquinone biosynthesis C-methylase UbiE
MIGDNSSMTNHAPTAYELRQKFNPVVSWLHSFRYKNILDVFTVLSNRVGERKVKVLEIGCAHAKLFGMLDQRFAIDYCGVDVTEEYLNAARERYGTNENFRIIHGSATCEEHLLANGSPDIIIALEILEHVPEHDVVRIIENIARIEPVFFVCSVPIEIGPAIWFKNLGSLLSGYMRHEEYTWAETFWAGFYKLDRLPPHGTAHKGFDWRWLAQTIRHNMSIQETRFFPFQILTSIMSTSVFFVAEPRK